MDDEGQAISPPHRGNEGMRGLSWVPEVRRWRRNYQELKQAIEACELNHDLLRPASAAPKPGRKKA
jgi:hypothetical protein